MENVAAHAETSALLAVQMTIDVNQNVGMGTDNPTEKLEVAGTIEAVAADVSGWQIGDRVMALIGGGGYAQFAVNR